MATRNRKNL